MQRGDIVVAVGTPRRFVNLKPGTLWKVTEVRGGGNITVGDATHQAIRTLEGYFMALDDLTKDQISGAEGTDLAVRLGAIEDFRPELKARKITPAGFVSVQANGQNVHLNRAAASALSKKNSDKLVQRKLVAALGGL